MGLFENASLLQIAAALTGLLLIATLTRRYLRLSHIPGPFLASFTDLWLAYKTWTGVLWNELATELHETYGPVVRWGPNRVSFSSADAIIDIFHGKTVYQKSASYSPLTVLTNGREMTTIITIRDEKRLSAVKRHMASGFSQSSFLKQETHIDAIMTQLLGILRAAAPGEVVEISKLLRYWSLDTLNQVAFSDNLGFMAAGTDIGNTFAASKQRFNHWRTWFALPTLEWLIYKNPLMQRFGGTKSLLAQMAMKRIQERKNEDKGALDADLLGRYLAASSKEPDVISLMDVLSLTVSTIHAGTEATATTAGRILADLLQHPNELRKLQAELDEAGISRGPIPPAFDTLAGLPYLDAVMRETMRWNFAGPSAKEKQVPTGGVTICGVYMPEGTDVSVAEVYSRRDKSVWGPDADEYRPERWTEASSEQWHLMEKHDLSFSQGRRRCLGIHLATIEIKKLLASLLTTFELSLAETPSWGFHKNTAYVNLKVRPTRRVR